MASEPTINAASGRPWEDSDVTDRAAQYDQQGHIRQVGIARYSDFSDSEHAIRSDCVVAVPQIGCNYVFPPCITVQRCSDTEETG